MDIGYSTLERLLVELFGLSETQREPLVGRFKYLQRLGGFGEHIDHGRARYRIDNVLRVVLTFELLDMSCKPTRAYRMVRTHWEGLRVNLGHAWIDACAHEDGRRIEPLLWAIVPHALADLGAADSMLDVNVCDHAAEMEPGEALLWLPGKAMRADRHALFVNLPLLLAACCEAFAIVAPRDRKAFRAGLDEFAATNLAEATG